MKRAHFGPDLLRFLSDLRDHNDREWFLAHKDRYETAVRDPFLRFVADLGPPLKRLNPHFLADPSPVGGSMMRIYRDTRFSRDKSPYKTAVAAHFPACESERSVRSSAVSPSGAREVIDRRRHLAP